MAHRGQEEAARRTERARRTARDIEGTKKRAIADEVVRSLQRAFASRAKEFREPIVHWDDSNMDHDTFWVWLTAREKDVLESDYSRNIATIFRSAVRLIDKEIAAPSPYELRFELVSSPVKDYHSGSGPARLRVKGVTQSHWVYKLYING